MCGVTAKKGRHIDINTKLAMASLLSQNKIVASKFEPLEFRSHENLMIFIAVELNSINQLAIVCHSSV